ncbi:hypothetical protein CAOG_02501 [Capsaspora owczarzaki ATCC 30864]|uniref:Inositol-pentakisphosphate 2-kinase n=1 Tax=Capsaspora owczarzaki (strain ATCC 30864) TaxID=595528 RepID=A0A0D2VMG6_CAPO3|nr:hypothetical protein CAOG_02501 [Capsaspora owczarzaki ATCC 30864]KJE91357.1 hypothetical protein CAOG_002501 [Capsaspora owczarzaki ATCC 30864]|eukprot:XP_004349251.1 hypothetical protein CAOG_02501 [Capsaspora owczarzaki ATCC 30864]
MQALRAEDWSYRGEGAANIVVSFTGDQASNPELEGKVLRIRKSPVVAPSEPRQTFSTEQNYAYLTRLIAPLLGDEYVNAGQLVPLAATFLQDLDQRIAAERPAKRVQAARLDCAGSAAQLLRDVGRPFIQSHDQSDTFCVEIKPKWGFLPTSSFIHPSNATAKLSKCRYCMHQWLKVSNGSIDRRSRYCPLDLFSGTRHRVERALHSLVDVPQNNVRVFRNGRAILTGDKAPPADSNSRAYIAELDRHLVDLVPAAADDSDAQPPHVQTFVSLLAEILLQEPLLQRLQAAQRLDHLDIEGLKGLYDSVIERHPVGQDHWLWDGRFDAPEWSRVVQQALARSSTAPSLSVHDVAALSLDEKAAIIAEYLLAATVKDCSIMVSVQRLSTPSEDPATHFKHITHSGTRFRYHVAVVDLDPKLFRNIPKYHRDDGEIVQHYMDHADDSTCYCSGPAQPAQ